MSCAIASALNDGRYFKQSVRSCGVANGTYRAIYTVRFEEAVFVLHCFQKKSKSGIATPKEDMDVIRARLKVAEALAKEMKHGKPHR